MSMMKSALCSMVLQYLYLDLVYESAILIQDPRTRSGGSVNLKFRANSWGRTLGIPVPRFGLGIRGYTECPADLGYTVKGGSRIRRSASDPQICCSRHAGSADSKRVTDPRKLIPIRGSGPRIRDSRIQDPQRFFNQDPRRLPGLLRTNLNSFLFRVLWANFSPIEIVSAQSEWRISEPHQIRRSVNGFGSEPRVLDPRIPAGSSVQEPQARQKRGSISRGSQICIRCVVPISVYLARSTNPA